MVGMNTYIVAAMLCVLLLSPASLAQNLSVRIDLDREVSGDLYLQLFLVSDSDKSWDGLALAAAERIRPPIPSSFEFEGLEHGMYALRGYVDVDGDGVLALNDKGRPLEPFGFSYRLEKRGASLRFSRAVFECCEPETVVGFSLVGRRGK